MIPEAARTLWEAIRKRMLDIKALPHLVEIGRGVPDGWPGLIKKRGRTPEQLERTARVRPKPTTLVRVMPARLYHSKTGRAFLKRFGSTDPEKLSRRRVRLTRQAVLPGAPGRTAA